MASASLLKTSPVLDKTEFVYGYQNLAFEVMKNGYIATVTLFQS